MKTSPLPLLTLVMFVLAACSTEPAGGGLDADPNAPDSNPLLPDADPTNPDADPNGWTELITATWTAPSGTEPYWCARKTVTEDIYITAFRGLSPLGTHHTVVTLNDPNDPNLPPDGEFGCSAGTLTHSLLFATGVGSNDLNFPPGVAVHVPAGRQITLNIHLFNVSPNPLSGITGTLVQTTTVDQVTDVAEMIFGGTAAFVLGTDPNIDQTASGNCTMSQDHTIVSVWPHMHQIGTHMKVEIVQQSNVIHDLPFTFTEQTNWPITPVTVSAGQTIRTTCTWRNTTGRFITFGDSSNDEMCLSGLYMYPPRDQGVFCGVGL